jgi:glycosyltransferase involved in cell wall biosynthesis
MFPSLTTTFIYREVLALRNSGMNIVTHSIWKPSLENLSGEAKGLVADTCYVFPLSVKLFLRANIHFMTRNPVRYMGTLCLVLIQPRESFKKKLRTLAHFGEGVYLAYQMKMRGIRHVHASFAHTAGVALIISNLLRIPFSFSAHAVDIYARNRILIPLKLRRAKFVITISNYNRSYLSRLAGNTDVQRKIHIIRYGVDVSAFSPQPRKEESATPVILSVGRLVEKKGFPYLVGACKILVERKYKFHCQIIGDGPQRLLLEDLIRTNGLSEYINLVGVVFQEKLKDYLGKADFFVLPCVVSKDGDRDGIPNVLIEAMAMEIPVISTLVSGIPELITHGKEGLLVPEKDETALADAMAFLLEKGDIRGQMGEAGRKRVEADFDISKTSAQLSEIFKKELLPK